MQLNLTLDYGLRKGIVVACSDAEHVPPDVDEEALFIWGHLSLRSLECLSHQASQVLVLVEHPHLGFDFFTLDLLPLAGAADATDGFASHEAAAGAPPGGVEDKSTLLGLAALDLVDFGTHRQYRRQS